MSFLIEDNEVWNKYGKTWEVTKHKLGINFYSEPADEYKYLRAKLRKIDVMIKTNFLRNGIPKQNMHYTCIAWITTDSDLTINKKNCPQVYLEECKYKLKKNTNIWIHKHQIKIGFRVRFRFRFRKNRRKNW